MYGFTDMQTYTCTHHTCTHTHEQGPAALWESLAEVKETVLDPNLTLPGFSSTKTDDRNIYRRM